MQAAVETGGARLPSGQQPGPVSPGQPQFLRPQENADIYPHPTISKDSTNPNQIFPMRGDALNVPPPAQPPGGPIRPHGMPAPPIGPPGMLRPGGVPPPGVRVINVPKKKKGRKSLSSDSSGPEESSGSSSSSSSLYSDTPKKKRGKKSKRQKDSSSSGSSRSNSSGSSDDSVSADEKKGARGASKPASSKATSSKTSMTAIRNRLIRDKTDKKRKGSVVLQEEAPDVEAQIKLLQAEIDRLRDPTRTPAPTELESVEPAPSEATHAEMESWKTLYRIGKKQRLYLGEPEWMPAEKGVKLRASMPLRDLDLYLDRHPEIPFIIFKDYASAHMDEEKEANGAEEGETELDRDVLPRPKPTDEYIQFMSPRIIKALKALIATYNDFEEAFPSFDIEDEIAAPYLFLYYMYPKMAEKIATLPREYQKILSILTEYLSLSYLVKYQKVIESLEDGIIDPEDMEFLLKPGDVVVKLLPHPEAFICHGWLVDNTDITHRLTTKLEPLWLSKKHQDEEENAELLKKHNFLTFRIMAWQWRNRNDGWIGRNMKTLELRVRKGEKFHVADNPWFPIRYAKPETLELLRNRGKQVLSFSSMKVVGYAPPDDEGMETFERYIIDFSTYRKLHPLPARQQQQQLAQHRNLGPPGFEPPQLINTLTEKFGNDDADPRLLVFPNEVTAYHLRVKQWLNIQVDGIRNVEWNKRAFDNLVIEEDTKHLVRALVSNQIKTEKATDMISGKGNGLIILLHGGPGTGKTFTAESVAELAERPLYPVTCGDIGTKAEEVEKYLESVLYLGKTWGCVVLLDEADVFLEERSLTDLQRNALVSVFLRVLEYYEGILVLTSNRVGIFDQAFKSRIQLALHYENLTTMQRRKIWRNFFARLRDLGEANVDYAGLEDHIDDLAAREMNGREIRNAITTARQLSQFDGRPFSYHQLEHVTRVAGRFEAYLQGVNQGFTDDQLARDGGLR